MTRAPIVMAAVAAGLLVFGTGARAQTATDLGNPAGSGDGSAFSQSPALGGRKAGQEAAQSIDETLRHSRATAVPDQAPARDIGNPEGSGDGSEFAQSPALGGKAAGEDAERSVDKTLKNKRAVVGENREQARDIGNPEGSGDGSEFAQSPALGGKAKGETVVQSEDRELRLKSTN